MSLVKRLVALERRQTHQTYTDAELRERLRPVALLLDLNLTELVEETRRFLAMSDGERKAEIDHMRRELREEGRDFDALMDEALAQLSQPPTTEGRL
jgi:hypothetical protein